MAQTFYEESMLNPVAEGQAGGLASSVVEKDVGVQKQNAPKRRRKKKVVVEESSIQGSGAVPIGSVGRMFVDEIEHGVGYFVRDGTSAVFVTHWHTDTKVLSGEQDFVVYDYHGNVVAGGKVGDCLTTTANPDALLVIVKEDVCCAEYAPSPPKHGSACTFVSALNGDLRVISGIYGSIMTVANRKVIAHSCSTGLGDCRAPLFDASGRIVGGHHFGDCLGYNAADLDLFLHEGVYRNLLMAGKRKRYGIGQQGGTGLVDVCRFPKPPGGFDGWRVQTPVELPSSDVVFLKHIVAKPGVDIVVDEVKQFVSNPLDGELLKDLRVRFAGLRMNDADSKVNYVPSNASNAYERAGLILDGLKKTSKAGFVDPESLNENTQQYIERVGRDRVIKNFLRLLKEFEDNPDYVWNFSYQVFGKKDKYNWNKLSSRRGRSIQASDINLKLFWAWCFGESDTIWTGQAGGPDSVNEAIFETGVNPFHPVDEIRSELYRKAKFVFSSDIVGWDRLAQATALRALFWDYFFPLCVGMPRALMNSICESTINSLLLCPDGVVRLNSNGNPSGGANTLRINCILNAAISWQACDRVLSTFGIECKSLAETLRQVFFEVCGDDNRSWIFAKLDHGEFLRRYLEFWRQNYPWEVKLEGQMDLTEMKETDWPMAPTFVGRRLVAFQGHLLTPLAESHRTLSKVLSKERGCLDSLYEQRLMGVKVALSTNIFLHGAGYVCDPTIAGAQVWMPEEFSFSAARDLLRLMSLPLQEGRSLEVCKVHEKFGVWPKFVAGCAGLWD